jgi:hypothetical protein
MFQVISETAEWIRDFHDGWFFRIALVWLGMAGERISSQSQTCVAQSDGRRTTPRSICATIFFQTSVQGGPDEGCLIPLLRNNVTKQLAQSVKQNANYPETPLIDDFRLMIFDC